MIVSRVSVFLVVAMSGLLITVQATSHAGVPESQAQIETRAKSSDLQLIVEVDAERYHVGENPSFKISFRNSGKENLLLNGGELLGNGAEIWSTIKCEFQAAAGQRLPLSLGWGVPGVAGRIYFLGVPLRAGSAYTISVTPKDYYVGEGERLAAGIYELACTYTGMQSSYRDSTQLPRCWEGLVTSNTARVEVIEVIR
jgi:hypothetical protein